MLLYHSMRIAAGSVLILSMAPTIPAAAQTSSNASKTLDALTECPKLSADAARLACFESAAREITAARTSGRLLALDRDSVIERKRQRFGLADSKQRSSHRDSVDRDTMVTEVHTTITNVKPASYARFILQLANSTVWQTIEPLKIEPRPGTAIVIKQSGFGGLKAFISGERPILIKRQY